MNRSSFGRFMLLSCCLRHAPSLCRRTVAIKFFFYCYNEWADVIQQGKCHPPPSVFQKWSLLKKQKVQKTRFECSLTRPVRSCDQKQTDRPSWSSLLAKKTCTHHVGLFSFMSVLSVVCDPSIPVRKLRKLTRFSLRTNQRAGLQGQR